MPTRITVAFGEIPRPPPPPQEVSITEAEYDLIRQLCQHGLIVTAIKFMRQQYGMGLKDGKDLCETIVAKGPRSAQSF